MPQFRKKPVTVEARQFLNDGSSYELLQWINKGQHAIGRSLASWFNGKLIIPAAVSHYTANSGDWIVCDPSGVHHPCKSDIFDATYEPIEPV